MRLNLAAGLTMMTVACCGTIFAAAVAATSAPATKRSVLGSPARRIEEAFDQLERLALRGGASDAEVTAIVQGGMQDIQAFRKSVQDKLNASGDRAGKTAANTPESQPLRERLCSLDLLNADLQFSAARLLSGETASKLLDNAVEAYRQARVEHRTLAISMMGHIGEARIRHLGGENDKARSALQTVLDATKNATNGTQVQLNRIATQERLECLLDENPQQAVKQAATWRASRPIASDAEWSARADWLLARAQLSCWASSDSKPAESKGADPLEAGLKLARSEAVTKVISPRQRLGWLIELERKTQRQVMLPAESLEWADLLASVESPDALSYYRRCAKARDFVMPADSGLRYAGLLIQAKDYAAAVEMCRVLMGVVRLSDAQRIIATRFESACLVQQFRQCSDAGEAARIGDQATRALLDVVAKSSDDALRRDCLREWAEVTSRLRGTQACIAILHKHQPLVDGDAYLLYALAAGEYEQNRRASTQPASKDGGKSTTSPRELTDSLARAEKLASAEPGAEALVASIALLKAMVQSSPPQPDRKAAVETLVRSWPLLEKQPALFGEAVRTRLMLLVDLGLTSDASHLVETLPQNAAATAGDAMLALAGVLADRIRTGSATVGKAEQGQVLSLCQKAVSATSSDDPNYTGTTVKAASILLQVEAARDARALLEGAIKQKQVENDPTVKGEILLMIAEAYRKEGDLNAATKIIDELAAKSPRSHKVLIARGQVKLAGGKPAEGLDCFRQARSLGQPGSEPWCEATLALVKSLVDQAQRGEAADIVRVSLALYPDFGNPQLLAGIQKVRAELSPLGVDSLKSSGDPTR